MIEELKLTVIKSLAALLRPSFVPGKITISEAVFRLLGPRSPVARMKVCESEISLDLSQKLLRYIYFGAFEPSERDFLRSYLRASDVAIDVGANYGYLSATMLCAIGNGGRVIAFEPNPHAYSHLQTLRKSAENRFESFQIAVSDHTSQSEDDKIEFFINPGESMWGSTIKEFTGIDRPESVRVETTSLSDFFESRDLVKVDFVKVDVEGLESKVLGGLLPFLRSGARPTIMCELSTLNASLMEESVVMVQRLADLGYSTYLIQPHGKLSISDPAELRGLSRTANIVLATDSEAELRLGVRSRDRATV